MQKLCDWVINSPVFNWSYSLASDSSIIHTQQGIYGNFSWVASICHGTKCVYIVEK